MIRSFRYALRGVAAMIASERSVRIHLAASVLVCAAGLYLGISVADWCWVVAAITLVWVAEGLNTALEFLTDLVSPGFHPLAEKTKDIAAGAVLIAVAGALAIGAFIFGPYLF